MSDTKELSPAALGICAVLSVLALLLYALQLATLSDLAGSDAAGNGYAQGYAAIEIILLWLLLAVIAIVAGVKGVMPAPALIAAVILIPASGLVAFQALELLSRPYQAPFLWPLIIPASIPPLVLAYCFWALQPLLRATIPARLASAVTWSLVFIACAAILPLEKVRKAADDRDAAIVAKYNADYAKLPADAPLWDWVPFFNTPNASRVDEILQRIGKLDRRQADAELMLARGDFPLGFLGRLDLTPTPALCDKALALLRQRVEPLVLTTPNSRPYSDIVMPVADALSALRWLIGYDCDATAEVAAWETMASAYRNTNYDTVELRELRDPKRLGNIVRNYPERFSQLTPKAHLRAWLNFTDKKEFHDAALASARKLDHRTADAVEMLRGDSEHEAWIVLEYLTVLDLEPTQPLCDAALWEIHKELARIARPKADEPWPYSDLLNRLGTGDPFGAGIWLASHGCDANVQLTEAENLIRSFQESPASKAMLAKLGALHRP